MMVRTASETKLMERPTAANVATQMVRGSLRRGIGKERWAAVQRGQGR